MSAKMLDELSRFLATFGYIGLIPFASGTFASAAGVLVCIALQPNPGFYLAVFALVTWAGFAAGSRVETAVREKDPSCVVIDEVSGMMISLFLLPMTAPVYMTAFFLFRAFDMFKVYPANRLEDLKGGAGIMMDDIIAGIYTNIVMHVAIRIAGMA
ncbi:MAG: phosphatidylglycerophosphatase A [Candidatus Omnitrophota bacterium]|nr:phosphatidylglycerophosphatase A [Candidatus Omnitrophota bacterium]MDZ4242939.1 phosphatidylglycerophosphatase A [Candidatus Omnitrophota bacterium]